MLQLPQEHLFVGLYLLWLEALDEAAQSDKHLPLHFFVLMVYVLTEVGQNNGVELDDLVGDELAEGVQALDSLLNNLVVLVLKAGHDDAVHNLVDVVLVDVGIELDGGLVDLQENLDPPLALLHQLPDHLREILVAVLPFEFLADPLD